MSLCTVLSRTGTQISGLELFVVELLHWRKEIKHVGVCSQVQSARDSDSSGISTPLLCSNSVCAFYALKTVIHNLWTCIKFPHMHLTIRST